MRANALREVLASGNRAVTGWMSIDSPYLAEVLSYCGYDAVTVDLQHGMFGVDTAVRLLQAVSAGPATPMARCPTHDPATIGKLLDAGAYGIVCPAVETAADAAAFVAACRYPPAGVRSFGPSRGLLYGGPDYVERANDTVLAWAMIESRTALDNVDAIAATPDLDGLYVGPNDLALSLGAPPGQDRFAPEVVAALARVVAAARACGIWSGVFCSDVQVAAEMLDLGFDLVTPGQDVGIIAHAARERVAAVRAAATDA